MNNKTILMMKAELVAIRERVDTALDMVELMIGIGNGFEMISEADARRCPDAEYQCKRRNQQWPHAEDWGSIRSCVYSPNWEYRFRRPIARTET